MLLLLLFGFAIQHKKMYQLSNGDYDRENPSQNTLLYVIEVVEKE
jgi:hypothetical protein